MREVAITPIPIERLQGVLKSDLSEAFVDEMERARKRFSGRTIWHINSTAEGGGVAELLQFVLGYLAGAGIDCRRLTINAHKDFFELTKQLHHLLHGKPGDGKLPGARERALYDETMRANLDGPAGEIARDDVVMLHDPQTVGLAPLLSEAGALVLWNCHIGADEPNEHARAAWEFLLPDVRATRAHVFSRDAYVWEGLSREDVAIIPPCIDACSPKNRPIEDEAADAILCAAGLYDEQPPVAPEFRRNDDTTGTVERRITFDQERSLDRPRPYVVQVSRWDPLKDPTGVLEGFASEVHSEVDLVLAGPAPVGVADDPEAEKTLEAVRGRWRALPVEQRARVHLACIPMEDVEENAAIVNALQRRAAVVVQKSLAEGFGLTVAEAMWKSRPVVGSRVGGIQDQIEDGVSGVLIPPTDAEAFGAAIDGLLADPDRAASLGARAHERATDEFLAPRYIGRTLELMEKVVG